MRRINKTILRAKELAAFRDYYKNLFCQYPDVVNTEDVRHMMGGIGINTVWKLIRGKHMKSIYYLNQEYLVPKQWLIDYLLSDHYQEIKSTLKHQV